jgi:Tol biopolymer transport system component
MTTTRILKLVFTISILITIIGCNTNQPYYQATPSHSPVQKTLTLTYTPLSPSITITLNPHPQIGEIIYSSGGSTIYSVDPASGKTKSIINTNNVTSNIVADPKGHLYFLSGSTPPPGTILHIYRVDLDGNNKSQITSGPLYNGIFAISPDGTRIAYTSQPQSGGNNYISVIDSRNGSHTTKVIFTTKSFVKSLAWSNNSGELAFFVYSDSNPACGDICGDLYIVNADGKNLEKINSNYPVVADPPAWSQDDNHIAFSLEDDSGQNLYLLDVKSQVAKKLTDSNLKTRFPVWSPSGNKILFEQGSTYCIISPDGTNIVTLADSVPDPYFYGKTAIWSPDGNYVAYVQQNGDTQSLNIEDIEAGVHIHLTNDLKFYDLSWINTP